MLKINPWINFNGNAEEAFDFYQSIFGGEIQKELDENNNLMFIRLPIGAQNTLISNNVPEELGKVNERENRSKIDVSTDNKEEAERIFNGLSQGGEVEVPMSEGMGMFFGMLRDKYGIEWIVEYNSNN